MKMLLHRILPCLVVLLAASASLAQERREERLPQSRPTQPPVLQPLPPRLQDAPRRHAEPGIRPDLQQPLPPLGRNIAPPPSASPAAPKAAAAPTVAPLPTDPVKRLDALFARLQDRENKVAAKQAEAEIEKLFERSGSATADLLFTRAQQALMTKDTALALDMLDFVTSLQPRFAEAYHRRALVHMMRQDEEAALRDLKQVLALEPRHYIALTGLASLMRNSGNKKGAYKVLTRVNEINPWIPQVQEALDSLRLDVEGQKI